MPSTLNGQDLHFSQMQRSTQSNNPANAGNLDADLRMTSFYRNQWSSVTVPYRTGSFSIDGKPESILAPLKGVGAGALIHYDDAGDGMLKTIDIRLNLSHSFDLRGDSVQFIRYGISLGIGQRSVDFSRLYFDSQFDGDTWNPAAYNGESNTDNRFSWTNLGAGVVWKKVTAMSVWNAGISIQHLNRPLQPFTSENTRRPILMQIGVETEQAINDRTSIVPQLYYLRQQKFNELMIGSEIRFISLNENNRIRGIGAGFYHRLRDAVIPAIYLYTGKFSYGFSYDINVSDLKKVSRAQGGMEISIIYTTRKIKTLPQKRVICPVY